MGRKRREGMGGRAGERSKWKQTKKEKEGREEQRKEGDVNDSGSVGV